MGMSEDFQDRCVLVYDKGIYVSWAERLARDFGKCYYYTPWKGSFPTSNNLLVGKGIPGVERVTDLWDVIDQVDLFVFPDVLDGDLQEHLRRMGKRVWGSGKAEELELYRWETKQLLKEIGLPVQPVKRIVGLQTLREYLMEHDDKAIKISLTRGDGETWVHENYDLSETKLDAMATHLGAKAAVQEFIVEDLIETDLEVGYDGYCIDGQFPELAMQGVEIKDQCLIDVVMNNDDLPEEVLLVNEKLSHVLKEYRMRGLFSTEIRVAKDGTPYLIDLTMRSPCPSGEIAQEIFENWAEIMWHGAEGVLIQPVPVNKWGAEVILESSFADKHWQPIYYPEKIANSVKLFHHTVIDGKDYVVPQESELEEIGAVVGLGDSIEEAIEACTENVEQVQGFKLEAHTDALAKAKKEIDEAEEKGISFSQA